MQFMAEKTAKKAKAKAKTTKPTVTKEAKPKEVKPATAKAKAKTTKPTVTKEAKPKEVKPATAKAKAKANKSKKKAKDEPIGDMGIVIVEDDLAIDQDKINEERRAYLEEARSQEAFD